MEAYCSDHFSNFQIHEQISPPLNAVDKYRPLHYLCVYNPIA